MTVNGFFNAFPAGPSVAEARTFRQTLTPDRPLVLLGRLLDGKGNPALEEGMLVVQHGRIQHAGPRIEPPAGAQVLDLSGPPCCPV